MVLMSSSVSQFIVARMVVHVRFVGFLGEVIQGMEVVRAVERLGSASGSTKGKIVISDSGTL